MELPLAVISSPSPPAAEDDVFDDPSHHSALEFAFPRSECLSNIKRVVNIVFAGPAAEPNGNVVIDPIRNKANIAEQVQAEVRNEQIKARSMDAVNRPV